MTYVFQSLGWPDLVAVSVPCMALLTAGALLIIPGPRYFRHFKTTMFVFSIVTAIFFYGLLVVANYFEARGAGFPALWSLLLNTSDAAGGLMLMFVIVIVLATPLWEASLYFVAWLYGADPDKGYKGPKLLEKLALPLSLVVPALFSLWAFRGGWLAVLLFGSPVPFEELRQSQALVLTNPEYPIRFTVLLDRVAKLFGTVRDNWLTAFGLVVGIATLIMFLDLYLIGRVRPAIKQAYARPDEENSLPSLKDMKDMMDNLNEETDEA